MCKNVSQNISNIYSNTELESQSLSNQTNQLGTKESIMLNRINLNLIANLADKSLKDDLAELDIQMDLPEDIGRHLAEMQKEEKEQASKEAAREILQLLKATQESVLTEVESIRSARRLEAKAKSRIAAIQIAKAYGNETQDYRPLMNQLDIGFRGHNVPGDYKPASATTPAKKTTARTAK